MSMIHPVLKASKNAMPDEFSGAMNLMAHPLAGVAAAGALGLGIAGQAFGIWMGTLAGVGEASHRLWAGLSETTPRPRPAAKLRLVASQSVPGNSQAVKPTAITRPARPDDLKTISGIGPKLERILNDFGIWTYAQIAGLSEAEIIWLDGQLGFSGRVGRDDWVGQASALLTGK